MSGLPKEFGKWVTAIFHGGSARASLNFPGDSQRPSYHEVQNLKDRIIRGELLSDPSERTAFISSGVESLANGTLSGADLGRFKASLEALVDDYYKETGNGEDKHIHAADPMVKKRAMTALEMATAIGYIEGSLAPNDLGFIPEQTLGLVRLDEIVVDSLNDAHVLLQSDPEMFGPASDALYNAVAARVDRQRPRFGGQMVRRDVHIPLIDAPEADGPAKPAPGIS